MGSLYSVDTGIFYVFWADDTDLPVYRVFSAASIAGTQYTLTLSTGNSTAFLLFQASGSTLDTGICKPVFVRKILWAVGCRGCSV